MKYVKMLWCMLIIPIWINAQTFKGQSEFSVSYGINSFQQTTQSTIFGGGSAFTGVTNASANLFLTYRYYLGKRFAIGLSYGQQQFSTASYDDYYSNNNSSFPYKTDYYTYRTIASEFLLNYMNRHWVRLYSYLGAGCSFYTVHDTWLSNGGGPTIVATSNKIGYNMQYVPLAISAGSMLSGFVELGIGYKGFLNGGVSYRFPYHNPVSKSHYQMRQE